MNGYISENGKGLISFGGLQPCYQVELACGLTDNRNEILTVISHLHKRFQTLVLKGCQQGPLIGV